MLNKFLLMNFTVFFLTVAGATNAMASPGGGHGKGGGGGLGGEDNTEMGSLSQEEIDGLLFMREEEK